MRGIWLYLVASGCTSSGFETVIDASDVDPIDAYVDPSGRVSEGLIGLWKFDDMGGANGVTITELTGLTPVVAPTIASSATVSWLPTSLIVNGPVAITTGPTAPNRLAQAPAASEQVTLEAWVTTPNDTQTGDNGQPARIASIGPQNAGSHHISLGQINTDWVAQVRTSGTTDVHGGPFMLQPVMPGKSTHLVVTAGTGGRKFYVDGVMVDGSSGGTIEWMTNGFAFSLAGEVNGNLNQWVGTFHLVAMYNQVLDQNEVNQNLAAGP